MNSKSAKDGIAGALIALILVFLAHQVWYGLNHDYRNNFEDRVRQDLRNISRAISSYHDSNQKWPIDLGALNFNVPKFKVPGANMNWEFDWIYYPAKGPIDDVNRNQIMLATPTHWDKDKTPGNAYYESFRIVAYYDGAVKKISEEEYQKQMNHNKGEDE